MSERIYRLTKTGRDAWESQDSAVPADYRRLLWRMDLQGHAGLMRELVSTKKILAEVVRAVLKQPDAN